MYGRTREKEESIYNLIPKTPEKPPKAERFVTFFKSIFFVLVSMTTMSLSNFHMGIAGKTSFLMDDTIFESYIGNTFSVML